MTAQELKSSGKFVQPIAARVQRLRQEKGCTTDDLGRKAGCSKRTIENIETGGRCLVYTLSNIAEALGVSLKSLMQPESGEEDQRASEKAPRFEVTIRLSIALEDFGEGEHLEPFLRSLKDIIGAVHPVRVQSIDEGSVLVKLEMADSDIVRLMVAYLDGKLTSMPLLSSASPIFFDDEAFLNVLIRAFPIVPRRMEPAQINVSTTSGPNRGVLFVSQDTLLRTIGASGLRAAGYRVLDAANGFEALQKCVEDTNAINLLVTDVVMPVISGRELAERVNALRPGVKTIFLSEESPGFTLAFEGLGSRMRMASDIVKRANEALQPKTTPEIENGD